MFASILELKSQFHNKKNSEDVPFRGLFSTFMF